MYIIYFGYAIQEAAQKERRNRAEFVTQTSSSLSRETAKSFAYWYISSGPKWFSVIWSQILRASFVVSSSIRDIRMISMVYKSDHFLFPRLLTLTFSLSYFFLTCISSFLSWNRLYSCNSCICTFQQQFLLMDFLWFVKKISTILE